MKLIKNPKVDHWVQFNNGIIDDKNKAIVMDFYPEDSLRLFKYDNLVSIIQAEEMDLVQWRI